MLLMKNVTYIFEIIAKQKLYRNHVNAAKMIYKRVLDCTSQKKPTKLFLANITIWSFSLSKVSLIILNDVGDIKETKCILIYIINEISLNILMIVILIKRYVIFYCNKNNLK